MTTSELAGLRESGSAFWTSVHAGYEIDARDRPVLIELCRVLDEITDLKAAVDRDGVMSRGGAGQPVEHPALGGLRAHRLTMDRLLVRLALPDEEGVRPLSNAQIHAKTAADARWSKSREDFG